MADYEKTTRELRSMLRRQMLEDSRELRDYARDLVIELEALRKAAREVEKAAKDQKRVEGKETIEDFHVAQGCPRGREGGEGVEGKETIEDFHVANEAFRKALDRLRRAAR